MHGPYGGQQRSTNVCCVCVTKTQGEPARNRMLAVRYCFLREGRNSDFYSSCQRVAWKVYKPIVYVKDAHHRERGGGSSYRPQRSWGRRDNNLSLARLYESRTASAATVSAYPAWPSTARLVKGTVSPDF
jgi:hypothetical protein